MKGELQVNPDMVAEQLVRFRLLRDTTEELAQQLCDAKLFSGKGAAFEALRVTTGQLSVIGWAIVELVDAAIESTEEMCQRYVEADEESARQFE